MAGQAERLAWLADQIPRLPGAGIVYTLTVRDAVQVAAWLKSRGIAVEPYSGQSGDNRPRLEQALLDNQLKALQLLSLQSPPPLVKVGTRWQLTAAQLGPEFWERARRLTEGRVRSRIVASLRAQSCRWEGSCHMAKSGLSAAMLQCGT